MGDVRRRFIGGLKKKVVVPEVSGQYTVELNDN
jgi:hypothetical protein